LEKKLVKERDFQGVAPNANSKKSNSKTEKAMVIKYR